MSAQEILKKALAYRDGDVMSARYDLQAAMTHTPACSSCAHRYGTNPDAVLEALALLD